MLKPLSIWISKHESNLIMYFQFVVIIKILVEQSLFRSKNMNYNKEFGLIYWATAGCASRVGLGVFDSLGDRYTYYPWKNKEELLSSFLHDQGIPPGCDDYQIICAIRILS